MIETTMDGLQVMETTAPKKEARWTGALKIGEIIVETPSVKTFRLVNPAGGQLPFTFLPGQFLTLTLPINGKPVRRSFTIASSPTKRDYADVTIKREPEGLVSKPLCDTAQVGDLWTVTVPYGHFVFTGKEAESIVLIGGGVGVTPMMAVFRYLIDVGWEKPIYLLYSYKSLDEYIYRDELIAAAAKHKNVELCVTLTREESPSWQGQRGRLCGKDFSDRVRDIPKSRVHICGPRAMIHEFKSLALELGVPKENVKIESFGAEKKPAKTP